MENKTRYIFAVYTDDVGGADNFLFNYKDFFERFGPNAKCGFRPSNDDTWERHVSALIKDGFDRFTAGGEGEVLAVIVDRDTVRDAILGSYNRHAEQMIKSAPRAERDSGNVVRLIESASDQSAFGLVVDRSSKDAVQWARGICGDAVNAAVAISHRSFGDIYNSVSSYLSSEACVRCLMHLGDVDQETYRNPYDRLLSVFVDYVCADCNDLGNSTPALDRLRMVCGCSDAELRAYGFDWMLDGEAEE